MSTHCDYVLYEDVKEDALVITSTSASDDERLWDLCRGISRRIDADCKRGFYPHVATKYYDHPSDVWVLKVDDDLLEVSTLTTQNGDTTIAAADYYLMCGSSYNLTPYDRIAIRTDSGEVFNYSSRTQRANTVVGTWGYHEDWDNAWQDSQDTVQSNPMAASATAVTVSDVDGVDLYGVTPRFKVGQLLKIDDEYFYVTAKNTATNVLTVIPTVNGTTATSHSQNTTIYVFKPMRDMVEDLKRAVAYFYRQTDAGVFETTAITDIGTIIVHAGIPEEMKRVILRHRKRRRGIR